MSIFRQKKKLLLHKETQNTCKPPDSVVEGKIKDTRGAVGMNVMS